MRKALLSLRNSSSELLRCDNDACPTIYEDEVESMGKSRRGSCCLTEKGPTKLKGQRRGEQRLGKRLCWRKG